jgi:5' nucleotidase, deoxy (Pyrimidine), cytosolic type C protein (NT5C)
MKEVPQAEIQFDIDGVIANLAPVILPRMNELATRYDQSPTFTWRDITSHDWIRDTCLQWGMNEADALATQMMWGDPDVVAQAVPYKGVRAGLRILSHLYGGRINFVTSRRASTRQQTLDWFDENLPFINPERIFQREIGDPRHGKEIKTDMLHRSGAMRHYEDEPETLRFIGRQHAVVMDRPYNRDRDLRRYERITSWSKLVLSEVKHAARRLQ